jgi:hypothetical protein
VAYQEYRCVYGEDVRSWSSGVEPEILSNVVYRREAHPC